jgi:arsenate reductase (glutaredoxin)
MSLTLHGIKNSDTMKKARDWLAAAGLNYAFHDYKTDGAAPALLKGWAQAVGWEALLNRAGATFRALPDANKIDLTEAKAIALMSAQPSLIKRPVLTGAGKPIVGFKPDIYAAALKP